MNTNLSSRFSLLKSILLFMGASFFAFLLCGVLHESGHYLASTILGVPIRGIVLHPFGQDYNIYLGDKSVAFGTPMRVAFEAIMAPFFNVFIGVMVSLLLWRRRAPVLLPVLLVGSTSLLMESVAIILEITEPNPSADWSRIMNVGIPAGILWLFAVVMLFAGCILMLQLLPLAGIRSHDPLWRKLVVLLAGFPVLLLCAVIYQTLFGGDYYVPSWRGYMLAENLRKAKLIQMGASIILLTMIAALHRPLFPWLDRLSHTPAAQVRWQAVLVSIGLAVVIITVQLVFFNDPTIVAR